MKAGVAVADLFTGMYAVQAIPRRTHDQVLAELGIKSKS
jgi:crotonobetainyl-CoA:carnitine CoA-transferase CaiB-like acyl-CoA transferase